MATSQRRVEANRRNCLKSTGPRSVNGRSVSRLNGLKHGLTAKTVVIPSEDPAEYHQLLADVSGTLVPRNRIETILTAQIAHASWMHDRVVRAQTARLTSAIEGADHLALEEVYDLGSRLFHDRRVPAAISGAIPWNHVGPRTSHSGAAIDPDDPARIVRKLSTTVHGCDWMLKEWSALRALLEQGGAWQGNHKFMAVRLLGHQPIDCWKSREISTLYVAAWSLNSLRGNAYSEIRSDLGATEYKHYTRRVRGTWTDMINAMDHENARRVLIGIVDRAIERVQAHRALAQERAARDEARRADCLSFDDSHEGELQRRYETSNHRKFTRSINEFFKFRRAAEENGCEEFLEAGEIGDQGDTSAAPEVCDPEPDNCHNPTLPQTADLQPTADDSNNRQTDDDRPATDNPSSSIDPQSENRESATDNISIAPRFLRTEANEPHQAAPDNSDRCAADIKPHDTGAHDCGIERNDTNVAGSEEHPLKTCHPVPLSCHDRSTSPHDESPELPCGCAGDCQHRSHAALRTGCSALKLGTMK